MAQNALNRIEKFAATKSSREVAVKATQVITDDELDDIQVLEQLKALLRPPQPEPKEPALERPPPANRAAQPRRQQPNGSPAGGKPHQPPRGPREPAREKPAPPSSLGQTKKPNPTVPSLTLALPPAKSFCQPRRPENKKEPVSTAPAKEPGNVAQPPAEPPRRAEKKADQLSRSTNDEPCCGGHHAAPNVGREKSRLQDVEKEIGFIKLDAAYGTDNFTYLDVGCAEGRITAAVVEALSLPPARAHACDIIPQPPSEAFTFTQNGTDALPYQAESFDVVTMFMAAHHFADAPVMFQEVRRVAKKGAKVLIRDHDCKTDSQRLFYDVVHAFYACVLGTESTPAAFVKRYAAGGFAHYRSKDEWVRLAQSCGFELDGRVKTHGPVIQGRYGNDRFDSFYAFLICV